MIKLTIERLALFKLANYRNYSISGLFFTICSGLVYIGLSCYAFQELGKVGALSLLIACMWLPGIICGPFFGLLADRISLKKLLLFATSVRSISIITYGCLFAYGIKPNIYLLAIIYGICLACYNVVQTPFVNRIVPKEKLLLANSTIAVFYEIGFFAGVGLSGVLLTLFSIDKVLLISGVLGLIPVVCVALISYDSSSALVKLNAKAKFKMLLSDYVLVLLYLKRQPAIIPIYSLQVLLLALMMTVPVLLLPFVAMQFHGNTKVFASLELLFSLGVVCGGLFSPYLVQRVGNKNTFLLLFGLMLLSLFVFSINSNLLWSYILYPMVGVGLASWALVVTLIQKITHDSFHGRVQGIFSSISGFLILSIYLAQELMSQWVNVQGLYTFELGLIVIALIIIWFWVSES